MGTVHGDDHSLGEQLAVAGLGGGTSGSLSPPNAAPQCKEPLCALIPSPGSSRARPGGHWQPPLGWGLPLTDVGHVPLSLAVCEHHTRLRVCPCAVGGRGRTVLFQAAGNLKDHSELPRAPTPQQLQVLALCSTCPSTGPSPHRAPEQMQEPSAQSLSTV